MSVSNQRHKVEKCKSMLTRKGFKHDEISVEKQRVVCRFSGLMEREVAGAPRGKARRGKARQGKHSELIRTNQRMIGKNQSRNNDGQRTKLWNRHRHHAGMRLCWRSWLFKGRSVNANKCVSLETLETRT